MIIDEGMQDGDESVVRIAKFSEMRDNLLWQADACRAPTHCIVLIRWAR